MADGQQSPPTLPKLPWTVWAGAAGVAVGAFLGLASKNVADGIVSAVILGGYGYLLPVFGPVAKSLGLAALALVVAAYFLTAQPIALVPQTRGLTYPLTNFQCGSVLDLGGIPDHARWDQAGRTVATTCSDDFWIHERDGGIALGISVFLVVWSGARRRRLTSREHGRDAATG